MKKAIIVGSKGQDGQLLCALLARANYSIIGLDLDYTHRTTSQWEEKVNINDINDVSSLIEEIKPDEVYYLAAYHHSSEDVTDDTFHLINFSYEVNVHSYVNFLESIKKYSNKTRIFYAATSHIFGDPTSPLQDEASEFNPKSIYGITKLDGLLLSRHYREEFGVFSSVGILYNHESHLRPDKFVSKKIVKAAVEILKNRSDELVLGDISAKIDWGFAGDYVEAMVKILNISLPDEFIIASGKETKLIEFISIVFDYLDLDWEKYVIEDTSVLKRKNSGNLIGNPSKLMTTTGWTPSTSLRDLAVLMIEHELSKY